MNSKVDRLFAYLDGLTSRPRRTELEALLRRLDLGAEDLAGWVHFSPRSYQRNLVRAGDWYHLWVMCWRNGQRSPIHDHAGSVCGVRILAGTATVTRFEFAANGQVKATASDDCPPGSVVATADDDLHQVSNLLAGNADLVTLHVFSPPLLRMGTYSLLDATRGEDVWGEERRVVTSFPENSETPLESVHGLVTPNRLFFVRNHFAVPTLDLAAWRLTVEGRVKQRRAWAWEELMDAFRMLLTMSMAGAHAPMAANDLKITASKLLRGMHIHCTDMDEVIVAKNAIVQAGKNLRNYLDVAQSFDGSEEIHEF